MPLPFLIMAASAVAGASGLASAGVGAKKVFDANREMAIIRERYESGQRRFEELNESATKVMDELGELELKICQGFERFSDLMEQIQNRPDFDEVKVGTFSLPKYDAQTLKDISVAASLIVGAVGGAGTGAASGVAAAFAAKGAIGALCAASTGMPIAALHGIAAENAIMAILGGGTLAAGGGGVALGATVLSAATMGIGILIGGIVFNRVGNSLSDKVEEASVQVDEADRQINKICTYLGKLKTTATRYRKVLLEVYVIYQEHMVRMSKVVYSNGKTDWRQFSEGEKLDLENLVLLVSLLYGMCKTNLVVDADKEDGVNRVNFSEINKQMKHAEVILEERGLG